MSRSLKKGPYVFFKLLKKINGKKPSDTGAIKTWARGSQISPEMVGFTFAVGGQMQKALDQKKKETEIAAAKAEKAAPAKK
jgi:small subunit ribosomal protein S19